MSEIKSDNIMFESQDKITKYGFGIRKAEEIKFMLWFVLLAFAFFVAFLVFLTSFRWKSDLGAVICGVIAVALCVVTDINLGITFDTPKGFETQEVYELTEDGVLRKSNTTYYQDESGDWYVEVYEDGWEWKMLIEFFYEFGYEKVDAPVFKSGNFIINNAEEDVSPGKHCAECGNKLNDNDKFCSDCGTSVKKKG